MPTWLIFVQVAAIVVTLLIVAVIFLRSGVKPAATSAHPADNAKVLGELGKALDLYNDLIAAGKTPDEAKQLISPAMESISFPRKTDAAK